jgi:release factor glutamine methyltransferase
LTLEQVLQRAREELTRHDIDDPAIEAEVLLRHTIGLTRSELYLELGREIEPYQRDRLDHLVARRISGEPTAYITGQREFYGFDFYVDRRVLIPRPESEALVEKALELGKRGSRSFADIGTGSGCIAVSLAVNLPQVMVYATDVSEDALAVARLNCRRHHVESRVCLLKGDLAAPLARPVDVIIANLPYVRRSDLPSVNTRFYEPVIALDGGEDGLDAIRALIAQAASNLNLPGSVLLEIGQGQEEAVVDALKLQFPAAAIEVLPDLAGIPRAVVATLPIHI